jgi:ElaB/YqjD/DUF883 family membrane-anchored ribosome-binding protein
VAGQVSDTAGQVVQGAQQTAGQIADQAQWRAQQAAGGFQQMLQENPLAVGAAAIAVGAAIGLAIPETPQEDQWMGEARENLMQRAQETVQQTAGKVGAVAQETISTAKDTAQQAAQDQGLTSS